MLGRQAADGAAEERVHVRGLVGEAAAADATEVERPHLQHEPQRRPLAGVDGDAMWTLLPGMAALRPSEAATD